MCCASTTAGRVVTNYLVDTNQAFSQVLEEQTPSGAVTASYVYGHQRLSQKRGATLAYYHQDGLGSTRALTNATGEITDTYTYNAFGTLAGRTGSTVNPFRFAGEQLDASTDLYYLRARYYSPRTGRFLSADTFAGLQLDPRTIHKYGYANGDPVNNVDPSGRFSIGESATTTKMHGDLSKTVGINHARVTFPRIALTLLLAGVLAVTPLHVNLTPVVLNDPRTKARLKEARTNLQFLVKRRVRRECKIPYPSFYYHTEDKVKEAHAFQGIRRSNEWPEPTTGYIFPPGAFVSDIAPWEDMTQRDLRSAFFGSETGGHEVNWFLAVCFDGFQPLQPPPPQPWTPRQWYKDGPPSELLVPPDPRPFVSVKAPIFGANLMLP